MDIKHGLIGCKCDKDTCPAYTKCCFLPTEIHPGVDGSVEILFVGQGGGRDERKQGRPFIGRAGKRLRQQVLQIRKQLKKHVGVGFSNTIRDNPEDNRVPSDTELECCLPHLYDDIRSLNKDKGLKMVVPLGNAAKNALLPDSGGPMAGDHGKFFKKEDLKVVFMPTYHPSYIMRRTPRFDPLSPDDLMVIEDVIAGYRYAVEQSLDQNINMETLDIFGM